MDAHVIPVTLGLEGPCVEVITVNWETPRPYPVLLPISVEWTQMKERVLNGIAEHLRVKPPTAPLFIVFPEISLPLSLLPLVQSEMVHPLQTPVIVVAGLEHLSHETFHTDLLGMTGASMPQLTYTPESATRHLNSAAVAISDGHSIRWFVQPKRKAHHEDPDLNLCNDVLVFVNEDEDRPFVFCVQVCSDFNSGQYVDELRSCIWDAGVEHIDLTVLVQFYNHQFNDLTSHHQLRDALEAYFCELAGDQKARTRQGAVLLVNRPRVKPSSTEFGDSGMVFPSNSWPNPSNLYLQEKSFFVCQGSGAALQRFHFRCQTPAVHSFAYARRTYRGGSTGGGEASPFLHHCVFVAEITGTSTNDMCISEFLEIPAEEVLARKCFDELEDELKHEGVPTEVAAEILAGSEASLEALVQQGLFMPDNAGTLTYYSGVLADRVSVHPHHLHESALWEPDVISSVSLWARAHGLLGIAARGAALPELLLEFQQIWHGRMGETTRVVYLWGGFKSMVRAVQDWLNRARTRAPVSIPETVLCAVGAHPHFDRASLRRNMEQWNRCGQAFPGAALGAAAAAPGEVVAVPGWEDQVVALDGGDMDSQARTACDNAALETVLGALLTTARGGAT